LNYMEEESNKPIELPPTNTLPEDPSSDKNRESFFRRALNRTKDAIRNVDEVITGREAFRLINERFERQSELNESLVGRLSEALEQMSAVEGRLDQELEKLEKEAAEQRATFELTAAEVSATAQELRETADSADKKLSEATMKQNEIQKQTASQLVRWNNDSESLKIDVKKLQSQLEQLQQSFKQFLITIVVVLCVIAALIVYLFKTAQ
jgi:chromosome segregation ATPase